MNEKAEITTSTAFMALPKNCQKLERPADWDVSSVTAKVQFGDPVRMMLLNPFHKGMSLCMALCYVLV